MKASELITKIKDLMDDYGDSDITVYIESVDTSFSIDSVEYDCDEFYVYNENNEIFDGVRNVILDDIVDHIKGGL